MARCRALGPARARPQGEGRSGAVPAPGVGESLIDAHAHLTDARFAGDLGAVLGRARAAGITRILTCGEDAASSAAALAIAREHPEVRAAVGVHPHRAASLDDPAVAELRRLAADPRVVAIGEIGIDLSGRSAPRAVQERAFLRQLDLAAELGLPVVVHVRDAGPEVRAMLAGRTVRGQLHCYSEGPDEIAAWRALGLVPSFAGPVTYRARRALREAVRATDALLVETDAPYLSPEGHRGERNEPAHVAVTYAAIAVERGSDVPALASTTATVARELFGPRW
ncbi:MAG TPA: TatD family hydrolase [Candidatus Limnocylindria bacterium]|nr:TatD family hydrolase [Candidatus Limnocylindria bacterium]